MTKTSLNVCIYMYMYNYWGIPKKFSLSKTLKEKNTIKTLKEIGEERKSEKGDREIIIWNEY